MNRIFFLLWFGLATASSLYPQAPAPVAGTNAATHEVFVACVPKEGRAAPLTLDSLSANDVKLTGVAPLGDRPFGYVWVTDALGYHYGAHMLDCCTRPEVDRGSVILGVLGAEGYASNAKEVEEWAAKRLQEAKGKPAPMHLLERDVLRAGIKKLDEISRGGPKIMFVSGSFTWGHSYGDAPIDSQFLEELEHELLVRGVHMFVWDTRNMIRLELFGEKGFLNDPADASGGWLFLMRKNPDPYASGQIDEQEKKLSRLFKSWYTVRVQTPPATKKDVLLRWKLKTTAECKLAAPSAVVVPAKK